MVKKIAAFFLLLTSMLFAQNADSVLNARVRATFIKSLGEDDFRSMCSGLKKCMGISYIGCTEADQKPWPKLKYDNEFCSVYNDLKNRGGQSFFTSGASVEILARLGRRYRVEYINEGTIPLSKNVMSFLFDNMPFTAQLINAYLDANYMLEYTSRDRRFFKGSNGRSLSGEFYWALQDSAKQKLGMRNVFFGYGHAQVLKWTLHGSAIAFLDLEPVSNNSVKYKLTAIVFPGNSVLNSIMQMKVFKSVVNSKIDNIVDDIKKAAEKYYSGNKEPLLKNASLKSTENVQNVLDFEAVVNGATWNLGDYKKKQKERERKKNLNANVDDNKIIEVKHE